MKLRSHKGFTIVELLVVVLIIGLLSAIAVPLFGRVMQQAKDKKMMTDMRNIAIAIGIYRIQYDDAPAAADAAGLITILKNFQSSSAPLSDIDVWGNAYSYQVSGDTYTLRSFGKDGVLGAPATQGAFDADNDTIVVNGVFIASHEGFVSVAH